jgi:hypothetical protein
MRALTSKNNPDRTLGRIACGSISSGQELPMLMTKERRSAIRTLRSWAISVLQETGAIREREEHGCMQDSADPHARERAFDIARQGSAGRTFRGRGTRGNRRRISLDRRHLP